MTMCDFTPDFENAQNKANEILICYNTIKTFPFSDFDLIQEMSDIVIMRYADLGVDAETAKKIAGSDDAAIKKDEGRFILLYNAIDGVEIADSQFTEAKGLIDAITDFSRNSSDGTLKAGASVIIEGNGLRIAGEDSGIWCAPVEGSKPKNDEATWTKTDGNFFYNTPKKLLFTLPSGINAGKYCFVLRTRCSGYSKHERKDLIETVSVPFELVA